MRFVSVGECMIEMSGGEGGNYRLGFAGDTFNTSWYVRALFPGDWEVDYVTALGDDLYSQQMRDFMEKNGIGTKHIRNVPNRRPGLYLIHQEGGDRKFTYWRDQAAARTLGDDPDALKSALTGADIVYFSGITLAILTPRPRGRVMKAIVNARNAGAKVVFDPNVRPALWSSKEVMASTLTAAATIADIVLPTHGDEAPLFGDANANSTMDRYLGLGVQEVAVKNGAEMAIVGDAVRRYMVKPQGSPKVVDPTGAGDSFNGAYLAARVQGKAPDEAARAAHRVAGIVIGHKGALVDPALVKAS